MLESVLTVDTPASSRNFVTRNDVKAELGIASGDTSYDARIDRWIKEATDAIENWCGRVFVLEPVTETFFTNTCLPALVSERFPITAITQITEDGVILPSANYKFDPEYGKLLRLDDDGSLTKWPCGTIVVKYSAGYTMPGSAPAGLVSASIAKCRQNYFSGNRDPNAKRVEIPGVRTIDYWVGRSGQSAVLPDEAIDALAPYKDYRL